MIIKKSVLAEIEQAEKEYEKSLKNIEIIKRDKLIELCNARKKLIKLSDARKKLEGTTCYTKEKIRLEIEEVRANIRTIIDKYFYDKRWSYITPLYNWRNACENYQPANIYYKDDYWERLTIIQIYELIENIYYLYKKR